ncbi:hypothetical protein D3C85_239500 [compost metagenome]
MNAAIKQIEKKYDVISVPLEKVKEGREISTTNSSLQSVLRKKDSADVVYYNVPSADDNIFCRHTIIARVDRAVLGEGDHPDMNDLYGTDLPWAGYVTFLGSSRQFRNKYGLQVFTRIVKEYDGILYTLCEGGMPDKRPPIIIKLDKHEISSAYVKLTLIDDTHPEILKSLLGAPEFPPKSLKDEMDKNGYIWQKDKFISKEGEKYSEIFCRIYGKFLTPPNGR